MAETTTAINACDVKVYLDDANGTPVDISGSTNACSMEFENNIGELRVLVTRWPIRLSCGKDATFSLVVVYSTAADEGSDILKDWYFSDETGTRTLTIYIPDKNVGADKYSGEVVMENLAIPVNAGEASPIPVSTNLKPSGSWTLTTNAT